MKTINNMLKSLVVGSLVCMGVGITSCTDNFTTPVSPTGNSLTQVAGANDSLQAFVAALNKVGLASNFANVNSGPFTLFAPSNYAFVKYLRSKGVAIGVVTVASAGDSAAKAIGKLTVTSTPVSISALLTPLTYHIISSSVPASSITGAQGFITMNGTRLSLSKVTGATYEYQLNADIATNGANIVDEGTVASNGVVYTIDRVMTAISSSSSLLTFLGMTVDYTKLPTDPSFITVPSGVSNYNLIDNALKKTLVITTLVPNTSPLPDYTLFVPDDASFLAYLEATYPSAGITDEASAITFINGLGTATTPTLAAFTDQIKYHALVGRILTTDIAATQSTLLTGHSITYDGVAFTVKGTTNANAINITSKNNLTNAGIVHVISGVLVN